MCMYVCVYVCACEYVCAYMLVHEYVHYVSTCVVYALCQDKVVRTADGKLQLHSSTLVHFPQSIVIKKFKSLLISIY